MNQAVAAQDDVGVRKAISCHVRGDKCSSLRFVELTIATYQTWHYINTYIPDVPQLRMPHPVEIATGSIE